MKTVYLAAALLLLASPAAAQTITTQHDDQAADMAEMKALAAEAHGDIYSLPQDKKMRIVAIEMKYFIRDNFVDPDSVHAVITNDPGHADIKVWQGIFGGGHVIYSGMAVCARINGKNRLGGYAGERQYLVIFTNSGRTQAFWSPYLNPITRTEETNDTVTANCAN